MKKTLLLFLILVLSISTSFAQTAETYRAKAEQGDAKAQNNLGVCYYNGQGVPKNYEQAVYWLKKAADQGYADAQNNLGICYEYGKGVPKNYEQAVYWLKKAADQGESYSQYNLGNCYYNGQGVTKNYEQAVYWYQKSANQGHSGAQYNLGICYEYGKGVPKNYEQAVYWYKKAANQGDADAQTNLGLCYDNGQGVPKNYEQAVYWYKKAVDQGYAIAQNNLGNCYYNGQGVPKNYEQAVYWYKKAADQGEAKAQNNLGNCYYNGQGVTKNYEQAVYWYQKSANQGHSGAQYNLGRCYYFGNGVPKDKDKAKYWQKKSGDDTRYADPWWLVALQFIWYGFLSLFCVFTIYGVIDWLYENRKNKNVKKITIIILSYIVSIGLLFLVTILYINHKDKKLYNDICNKYEKFFKDDKKYIDTEYSDEAIQYQQCYNLFEAQRPDDKYKSLVKVWEKACGDINEYYSIKGGWSFYYIRGINYGDYNKSIIFYYQRPIYVGYRQQEYDFNFRPDIASCVNMAYNYYVEKDKDYKSGNKAIVEKFIFDANNDYYMFKYGSNDDTDDIDINTLYNSPYVENGFCRVFLGFSGTYETYTLCKIDSAVAHDKKMILIIGIIILSIIFIVLIIIYSVKYHHYNKLLHESLRDSLLRLCNPANFMKPYDADKVSKSNKLWHKTLDTYDKQTLIEIREQAIKELNINFVNPDYLKNLQDRCDPKRFINKYNSDQLNLANELYNKILANSNNITVLEEIENEINNKLR